MAAEFSVVNGLLMRGSYIVIPPPSVCNEMSKIHIGHQGITKCREKVRQSVSWPRISTELEELVRNCSEVLQSSEAESATIDTVCIT